MNSYNYVSEFHKTVSEICESLHAFNHISTYAYTYVRVFFKYLLHIFKHLIQCNDKKYYVILLM